MLRVAWEWAVEEILLNGIVERFRENVQTQQILSLHDITEEDCKTIISGMTKCSKWLRGHDQSPAVNEEIPGPEDLKTDIDALENLEQMMRKRRSS